MGEQKLAETKYLAKVTHNWITQKVILENRPWVVEEVVRKAQSMLPEEC